MNLTIEQLNAEMKKVRWLHETQNETYNQEIEIEAFFNKLTSPTDDN